MAGRIEPGPHSLSPRLLAVAGWAAFVIAGAIFIMLAWNVAAHAPVVQLDLQVTEWLRARRTAPMTGLMLAVTHAHSIAAMILWSVGFAAILWRMRKRYWIFTLVAAMAGGMALNWTLKLAYERARPLSEDALVHLSTYSFPSGHTAAATTFYGVLAAFMVSRHYDHGRRAAWVSVAVLAIALVAFSRVYLGAHHLSDVIAAACSATAWLVVCLASGRALVHRRMAAP
jgi:undecaprenyl-diphosphatase